ncbi:MAG: hypothetical protein IPG52_08420, partial [Rhodocyclaceae bacterium]|nr:hypothetical protein [Rhodocyclaceae bacterium]
MAGGDGTAFSNRMMDACASTLVRGEAMARARRYGIENRGFHEGKREYQAEVVALIIANTFGTMLLA